ncbi:MULTISPECIES: STAS domain-containing protein [Streptomyces]|uniref:STAS domain-containing protein n=1 Tax=Streptomyces flaveolus TaxID=67297 RepID=A0ABV3A6R3_9ACTN|nr:MULTISPECIES: STAS domain-containing protein [Streptomyces]
MSLPQLNIYRHDRGRRALITLAGEIDPATAPQVRAALERCLHDGITVIDVDLTTVDRCDSSGLRVFLDASRHAAGAHVSLRLHYPSPQNARLLADMGSDRLLLRWCRERRRRPAESRACASDSRLS